MGKKARKTRWRTLTIADEHSDSEESNTTTAPRLPNGYQQKSYYNKFSYSSQSTPRRRYQHDSTKSTRSSSTTSENKITFNEDEYTRITTPRQDVLFKKGYLNKPKTYQTQTSTGTSTTSTGNSTGNGTPDHQSTDLDYESQFVFPNGFVDQNGIYYVNSYESYPLMLYNPQTYYPEFSNCKSKRYSTGSLTESMSPNNEEATSQDLSGGEASNNVSDYSGHHQVYNMVYPGYYVNGVCPPNGLPANGQSPTDQTRRVKKRRRRKTSKSQTAQDSSEYTDDETDSCDEEKSNNHPITSTPQTNCEPAEAKTQVEVAETLNDDPVKEEQTSVAESIEQSVSEEKLEQVRNEDIREENESASSAVNQDEIPSSNDEKSNLQVHQPVSENSDTNAGEGMLQDPIPEPVKPPKSDLKPDAEEFVPRAYRSPDVLQSPNVQFIKVPPNFVPIPMVPLGDFNGQNFNPAFIPPGIPINFLPPDPKLFPNFVGFAPTAPPAPKPESEAEHNQTSTAELTSNQGEEVNSSTAKDNQNNEPAEITLIQNANSKTIDIATIVSKLEEAAKEQENEDAKKTNEDIEESRGSPRKQYYENKHFRTNQKYKNTPNYRKNNYNNPKNSPQKTHYYANEDFGSHSTETPKPSKETPYALKEESKGETSKDHELSSSAVSAETRENGQEDGKHQRNSPEKTRKNWKYQPHQGSPKWQPNGVTRDSRESRFRNNGKTYMESDSKERSGNRNYSEMLKNRTPVPTVEQKAVGNDRQRRNIESPKKEAKFDANASPISPSLKQPNQWISVSSRKKRKNKNVEESDASFIENLEEEKDDQSQNDAFESYDVNQLVDVVPIKAEEDEIITVETTEEIQDIIKTIMHTDTSTVENDSLNVSMKSVTEIEEELIVKVDITAPENAAEVDVVSKDLVDQPVDEFPELSIVTTHEEITKTKGKKKSKKGTQKPLAKRVMITDIDLSMTCDEVKTPVTKTVTKLEDVKVLDEKSKDVDQAKAKTEAVTEESAKSCEDEKKKGKKKKKKSSKTILSGSLSSSNATINVTEDSYDFLLDSALSEESVEKTNIEISQELDKIIQKGMYSSLEEKMRSLNIDESDGFFKSIFSKITSRESSVEKTGYATTPDLTKILQNSSTLLKPSSVSQENNSHNKDINKILPDLDSPVEDGFFLENPELNEILHDQTVTKDTEQGDTAKDPDGNANSIDEAIKLDIELETKSLYPITQAVKEWMCKTRETTPDVEILKSPHAIYREFCDSASETDTISESKTLSLPEELNASLGDGEITIYSRQNSTIMEQSDLPESEDDLDTKGRAEGGDSKCFTEKDCLDTHIEQGEDAIEVYDSKYGRNEDYLNLQKEVREKTHSLNYPKHANMPYRAICCSIM